MEDIIQIIAEGSGGYFSPLDRRFAIFMADLSGGSAPAVALAAALVSRHRAAGHICIDLAAVAGRTLDTGATPLPCPPLADWLTSLQASPVVGRPGDYRPLILDGNRLYLCRHREEEASVAERLREDALWTAPVYDDALLRAGLDRLFPVASSGTDWQKIAAALAVLKRFCVISGGPGTGKTTTVARILALLIEQAKLKPDRTNLRIALCAPTGKAAARLQEAIHRQKDFLDCSDTIKDAIPGEASTIHRLLGVEAGLRSAFVLVDTPEPLAVDLLVIDEASMVDLPLLARLVKRLPPRARLILLGDKDQLASVEAGAVLADICDTAAEGYDPVLSERLAALTGADLPAAAACANGSVGNCIITLQKSYRFDEQSGMGRVSRMINAGEADTALDLLKSDRHPDIAWKPLPPADQLMTQLGMKAMAGFADYLRCEDPAEAMTAFNRFRLLCALREGPYGVRAVNALIERLLVKAGLVRRDGPGYETWYRGRPVLIVRNDYALRLFNGDVGLVLPDPETGRLCAFFQDTDGALRKVPPLRLPEHETVYAMTVHKSQGSEFDDVVLILPDRSAPVLTRELLYTAVTRARHRAEIWGHDEVFTGAVARRIERESGLNEALQTPLTSG